MQFSSVSVNDITEFYITKTVHSGGELIDNVSNCKGLVINSEYIVYITSDKNVVAYHRASTSSVTLPITNVSQIYVNSTFIACVTVDHNIILFNLTTAALFTLLRGESNLVISQICWHPHQNTFAAVASNKTIFIWNIESLLLYFEASHATIDDSNADIIGCRDQPTYISYDTNGILFYTNKQNQICSIQEGLFFTEYQLTPAMEPTEKEISYVYHYNGFLILGCMNNTTLLVYKLQKEDEEDKANLVQTIVLSPPMMESQLTFLPNVGDDAVLVTVPKNRVQTRFLQFSTTFGCFTYLDDVRVISNIRSHSAVYNNDTNSIDLLLYQSLNNHLGCYSYTPHFEELPPFDVNYVWDIPPPKSSSTNKSKKENKDLQNQNKNKEERTTSKLHPESKKTTSNKSKKKEVQRIENKTKDEYMSTAKLLIEVENAHTMNDLMCRYMNNVYQKLMEDHVKKEEQMFNQFQKELISFCRVQMQSLLLEQIQSRVETFTQEVSEELCEQITADEFVLIARREIFEYFNYVLCPSVIKIFENMHQQITSAFELGVANQFQSLVVPSQNQHMDHLITNISSICKRMAEYAKATSYTQHLQTNTNL